MPYLDRDGVRLYYEEAASGPPMLLIHGWTCDHITGQTVGAGHCRQLEVTEQVNAMLGRFLQTAL